MRRSCHILAFLRVYALLLPWHVFTSPVRGSILAYLERTAVGIIIFHGAPWADGKMHDCCNAEDSTIDVLHGFVLYKALKDTFPTTPAICGFFFALWNYRCLKNRLGSVAFSAMQGTRCCGRQNQEKLDLMIPILDAGLVSPQSKKKKGSVDRGGRSLEIFRW